MQSLLRRAWPQDQNDKKPEKVLLPKPVMRPSSVVEMPPLFRMKRKRSDVSENALPSGQDFAKRRKISGVARSGHALPGNMEVAVQVDKGHLMENAGDPRGHIVPAASDARTTHSISTSCSQSAASVHNLHSNMVSTETLASQQDISTSETDTDTTNETERLELRQVIEHQVNLEILLKHNELRLIEQELAKCQVALEQLRRCELVPYPGSGGLSEAVSTGTGPSLKAPAGFTQPQSPAPWGVADGPYTRHYARWLLNDPTFDTVPFQQTQPAVDYFSAASEGRSTRNSGAGLGRSGKSRASRDSVGNFGHALPNYPVHSRGKGGPLVIKRMADNQFVKLICNNCQRGDFSSVQGFLNHCRIAHKVDYKSHEAAATDCGRPLDDDEAHMIPPVTPAAAAAPPIRTPGPKAPPPLVQVATTTVGYVHPFNAPSIPRYTWKVQAAAARAATAKAVAEAEVSDSSNQLPHAKQGARSIANKMPTVPSFHSRPLVASAAMPYLSNQFAKRGLGGNIAQVTSRAQEKIDLGPDYVDEDERPPAFTRKPSTSETTFDMAGARFATPSENSPFGRPQSRKGQHAPVSRPRPAPLASQQITSRGVAMEIPESPQDSNQSPHTADSNPGLVSDHEDDDAVSDMDEARSERHASPDGSIDRLGGLRRGIGCGADAIDVEVEADEDVDGHHGVLIRPRGLAFQEFAQRPVAGSNQRPINRFGEGAK